MNVNKKTDQNCPLCRGKHAHVFHQEESFGYPLTYYQCETCGVVFQHAAVSPAADPSFYKETYRRVYQASEEPTPKDLSVQKRRALNSITFLKDQGLSSVESALDIGASAGVLMDALKAAYGCQVTGVEPGRVYRSFAQSKGLHMVSSLEELANAKPKRFDLVSLMHVLEHLVDPLGTLKTLRQDLMNTDSRLLIQVPNFYAHDSYELAHLICFTPHSLRELVQQAGFKVLTVKAHGSPRSKLLNLYLTLLAKPLSEEIPLPAIKPDRQVPRKRQLGILYRKFVQKAFPHSAWLPLETDKK